MARGKSVKTAEEELPVMDIRCKEADGLIVTWMTACLSMRERRPTMAFDTVHSSRYEPWLMIASLIVDLTTLAGGRKRGDV